MPDTKPWPATRKDDTIDVLHGVKVRDPYRWLEDETSPEVQAWMRAQDDYARRELSKLPGRDELAQRLGQLFYYDAISAPVHRKSRYFYTRKHADKERAVVYWREGEAGAEQVLLDPNTWASDKSLRGWWPSEDGNYVAYKVSEHNSDEAVFRVLDVSAQRDLPDVIDGADYGDPSWEPSGHGFYYTWLPPAGGSVSAADRLGFAELRFHELRASRPDTVSREPTHDPAAFLSGEISRDGHWLVVSIRHGESSSDIYFKDARKPGAHWTTLTAGTDAIYDVTVWRDQFYVWTNDGAPNHRIVKIDPMRPERAAWKEIVPACDQSLDNMQIIGERLVLTYLRDAASEIYVHDLDGKRLQPIALPPLGSVLGIVGNPDEDTGYISYTSFTEPQIIFKASIQTGKVDEWARVKLPLDTTSMTTEQVFYTSKDGTKISMFLIHRKDVAKSGRVPVALTGYGGFRVSWTPEFGAQRAAWVERGGVLAVANLRGGGEYGESWHRAGMLLHKQNVFDDFIAAAQYLVDSGWTSRDHLAIYGGSNGGLLVGAVMAQRPDLFKAVICQVPLLDMLRFHLFGRGKFWISEYGSPDDPDQFRALWAYSPYRVAVDAGPRAYPAVLFDSADHDDRVDPLHARKLAATIQALQTADAPVLLRIERNAGHRGADTAKQQVERAADQLAFLWAELR
jgi:prolyl oligopeptidase